MNRKQIGGIAITVASAFLLAAILLVTMPIWFTALMISPSLINPIQEKVMRDMTKRMTRMMFSRPSKVIP